MKTQAALLAAVCVFAGSIQASSSLPVFPVDALEDSDPRVVAFYSGQCEQWAAGQGLQGIEKQEYVNNCQANGPAIWPFGTVPYDGTE